jgi:hypothetical protein
MWKKERSLLLFMVESFSESRALIMKKGGWSCFACAKSGWRVVNFHPKVDARPENKKKEFCAPNIAEQIGPHNESPTVRRRKKFHFKSG